MVQFPDFGTVSEWRYGGGDKQGPIIGRLRYKYEARYTETTWNWQRASDKCGLNKLQWC